MLNNSIGLIFIILGILMIFLGIIIIFNFTSIGQYIGLERSERVNKNIVKVI